MHSLLAALVLALVLSGCTSDAEETARPDASPDATLAPAGDAPLTARAQDASHADITRDATSADDPTFTTYGCREVQGSFPADAADFNEGLPAGFGLILDELQRPIVVAVVRACEDGTDTVFAFVRVHAPEPLALEGGEHGILLVPSFVDSRPLYSTLRGWNVSSIQATTVEVHHNLGNGAPLWYGESRTTARNDFILTVDGTGGFESAPFAALRIFDIIEEGAYGAYDSHRGPIAGLPGPATVHFVYQGPGDFPHHRVGRGFVGQSEPVDITYHPVALPAGT